MVWYKMMLWMTALGNELFSASDRYHKRRKFKTDDFLQRVHYGQWISTWPQAPSHIKLLGLWVKPARSPGPLDPAHTAKYTICYQAAGVCKHLYSSGAAPTKDNTDFWPSSCQRQAPAPLSTSVWLSASSTGCWKYLGMEMGYKLGKPRFLQSPAHLPVSQSCHHSESGPRVQSQ